MLAVPQVRLAVPSDARSIAVLSRDFIEHGLGWSWNQARILRAIRSKSVNVAVVHERGCIVAFGIMEYGEDTAHLGLLGVQPKLQGQGLGAHLVRWLEECAITAGIRVIRVEARADNPKAIAFYQKQGFHLAGRVSGYYRGVIDTVRLEKGL